MFHNSAHQYCQGSTLTVARLPGATDFSTKLQTVAPWAIAAIFTILNFSDCHNRQRMSVASRAIDKLGGRAGQGPPKSVSV